MIYAVFISEGDYSDYRVTSLYLGDVEPKTLFDKLVKDMSDGKWRTEEEMYEAIYPKVGEWDSVAAKQRLAILQKVPQMLESNGFKNTEWKEYNIGDI